MGLVTIILTTLNSEKFIARSIDSCLRQTYPNLELIIVDGGSQDRTLEIIQEYQDSRLRVIHQQDNVGKLPGAINLGMANARGQYITWTQDDNWYEPEAIEVMLNYLNSHPETDLVYTDFWIVNEDGKPIEFKSVSTPDRILKEDVVGQCFLFRRRVYDVIGPQNTQYFPVHEVPWRVKVNSLFRMEPLHRALMYWTLQTSSLTGKYGAWRIHYLMLEALLQAKLLDRSAYSKQLAETHICNGYDEFVLNGNYRAFRQHIAKGFWYDISHIKNRGLWKLALVSLLPNRDNYRKKLYQDWKAGADIRLSQKLYPTSR